jgi:hypothetical protein
VDDDVEVGAATNAIGNPEVDRLVGGPGERTRHAPQWPLDEPFVPAGELHHRGRVLRGRRRRGGRLRDQHGRDETGKGQRERRVQGV